MYIYVIHNVRCFYRILRINELMIHYDHVYSHFNMCFYKTINIWLMSYVVLHEFRLLIISLLPFPYLLV